MARNVELPSTTGVAHLNARVNPAIATVDELIRRLVDGTPLTGTGGPHVTVRRAGFEVVKAYPFTIGAAVESSSGRGVIVGGTNTHAAILADGGAIITDQWEDVWMPARREGGDEGEWIDPSENDDYRKLGWLLSLLERLSCEDVPQIAARLELAVDVSAEVRRLCGRLWPKTGTGAANPAKVPAVRLSKAS